MKLPTNLSSTRFSLQKNLLPDDWVQIKMNMNVDLLKIDSLVARFVLKILSDAGAIDIPFKFRFCIDNEKLTELCFQHPNASKSDEIRKIEAAI